MLLVPIVDDHPSTLLGYCALFCMAVMFISILVTIKEWRSPSRWNRTPEWLVEARASGELD